MDSDSTSPPSPGVLSPKQERSRRTQEKILAAAERMLRRRLLDELTVTGIAREAGVSVGAFYARFESKDALVPAIGDRYAETLEDASHHLLRLEAWEGLDLEGRARRLVRLAMRVYLRNRGIIRALNLHWRTHPEEVVTESLRRRRQAFDQRLIELFLPVAPEIRHPDPALAARFAIKLLGALLRDVLLVPGDHPHADVHLDERGLARETTRALVSYLTCAPPRSAP